MDKIPILDWFLDYGDVLVTIDTKVVTVDIPAHLRDQEVVDFILGATPTPKMEVDKSGIRTPMRFSGVVHHCFFPWEAVLQMSAQDAVIQFRNAHNQPEPNKAPPSNKAPKKDKTHLRVVK